MRAIRDNLGTPASYESRKGIENIEGPKDETGKMADRTAIASTFHITSTRIDIFKLILTSHPYSTLFSLPASHHSLFFIPIFAGKYLMRKTLGISSSQRYMSVLSSCSSQRGSIERLSLTQRSMRIYILSRSGIAACNVRGDISLYARVPNSSNVTRIIWSTMIVAIRSPRREVVHLDSIDEKKRPEWNMHEVWEIDLFYQARAYNAPLASPRALSF